LAAFHLELNASHSFHCCIFPCGTLYSRKMYNIKSVFITLRNTGFKFFMASPEKNSRIMASFTYTQSNGSVIGSDILVWRPQCFFLPENMISRGICLRHECLHNGNTQRWSF
jgi:hypothetical protein